MYIVPQSAPAASAAAMPRPGWPPGAWVDDATASSVPPANITAAPPSTPRSRGQPAPRSSLKNTAPQTMPSRLFAFHNGNAMLSPMSLIAKIVRVLATAHRHPARIAQTTRWGAWRTSAPIADVPRSRAGRLQRARNAPTTIAREITTGERPRATILVGASAAPSQAPAAKPLTTPASCRRRRRAASSATGATSGSTRARPGRRRARQRGPTAAGPAAWRRGGYGRRASHWLQSEVARGELPGHDLAQGRGLGATARVLLGVRAAWVKRAAGRRVRGRRHVAGEHDALPLDPGIGHRHGGEERRRVGVARGGVQGCRGGPLDDLAEIHHRDMIGDVLHDREVMGDEEVSELPPLLQVGQQVQHLRLDGDVERAHRLVEQEELRLERLGEGLPHGHAGIEGAVGVLKHDLHPPPQGAELAWPKRQHVLAVERDAAGVGLDQAEDHAPHRGLAAARFTHEPEGLARPDGERYAVHGPDRRPRPPQPQERARSGKVLDEPLHVDQRRGGGRRHGRGIRRRGSVRSQQRTVWAPGSPVPASSSGGSSSRQRSQAYPQRGWNRHPPGHALAAGTCPGMLWSRPRARAGGASSRGTEARSPSVYGWSGRANSSVVLACSTTCPAYITTTRSARPATSPRSWVMSMTAMPSSACRRSSSSRIWAWIVTSSAVVGSSAISSLGWHTSAIAIITRCRMPPLI